ncbi:MAG: sensor histidine kinase [Gammaproteobacteria bacterium]
MIKGVSIERRVVRAFVGLMAVAAVFYAGFVILVAYVVEDEIIDRLLSDEVRYLQDAHAATGQLPVSRLAFVQLYEGVAQAPEAVADKMAASPDRREIFTSDERHFHVRYLTLSDQTRPLLVAEVSALLVVTNISSRLLFVLATVLAVLVGAALWLAYRIARQTTRPIVDLSAQVQRGQQSGEVLALTSAGQSGEVGYLAEVIQSSFNQLHDALNREHHFTRDVSHELRTPLTVMKNTLALMAQRPAQPGDTELLLRATNHMQATVTALMGLAREESMSLAPLRLRPIVEECVLALDETLERAGFAVEVSIPDDYEVYANAHLLALLVTNLIDNAVQYACESRLDITAHENALRFSNAVSAPVAEDIALPAHKGAHSQGLGQGLFLVKRIADALRWQLLTQTSNDVFSATLHFTSN